MITKDQIKHIATLARINVPNTEIGELTSQLSDILSYVKMLDELDLSGIEPTAHAVNVHNVFRADVVQQQNTITDVLSGAPETDGVFFRVPKVL